MAFFITKGKVSGAGEVVRIKHSVSKVPRSMVCSTVILPGEDDGEAKKNVFIFTFENGFKYFYGSNKTKVNFNEIVEDLRVHFDFVIDMDNAEDLQKCYLSDYEEHHSLENCLIEYEYYMLNADKINEILSGYGFL